MNMSEHEWRSGLSCYYHSIALIVACPDDQLVHNHSSSNVSKHFQPSAIIFVHLHSTWFLFIHLESLSFVLNPLQPSPFIATHLRLHSSPLVFTDLCPYAFNRSCFHCIPLCKSSIHPSLGHWTYVWKFRHIILWLWTFNLYIGPDFHA